MLKNHINIENTIGKSKNIHLIMILLLLLVHDNLVFAMIGNQYLVKGILFGVYCFFYLRSIYLGNNKFNLRGFIIITMLMTLVFMNMLFNQDFSGGYLLIVMLLVMAFITSEMLSFDEFVEGSIKIIFYLTIYSLICYALSPIIFQLKSFLPHFYNAANTPFIHLGATVLVDINGYNRLFGMFRESGVYQIFLNLAILMELFYRKDRPRFSYLIVLYIGLLLTYSTAGYIATLMILVAYLFFSKKRKSRKEKRALSVGIIATILFTFITYISNSEFSTSFDNTWGKFFNKESSYIGRTTSFMTELSLWWERPIFGHGIEKGFGMSKEVGQDILGNFMFNTSTITGLLVTMGFIFSFMIILLMALFSFKSQANILGKSLILVAIGIMITSQLMMYNAYFYTLVFMAIKTFKKPKNVLFYSIEKSVKNQDKLSI